MAIAKAVDFIRSFQSKSLGFEKGGQFAVMLNQVKPFWMRRSFVANEAPSLIIGKMLLDGDRYLRPADRILNRIKK